MLFMRSTHAWRLVNYLWNCPPKAKLNMPEKRTLFEKVWDEHVVCVPNGSPALLYIDLHLVHEVTSPQAFDGLRIAGRRVRQPDALSPRWTTTFPPSRAALRLLDPIAAQAD